jgi:CO dehydrogenase/acetyl-CoA synthase epsilon subunit
MGKFKILKQEADMKRFLITVISLLIILPSCGSRQLVETKFINEKAKLRFIIAGDSSEFKDSIREEIIEKYKNSCNIEIVNIEKLGNISRENFDFILIMQTIKGWGMLNPEMKDFINKIKDKDRIILFATSMNPYYNYSYEGIDAVTTASQMEKKDEIVKKLSEKIDGLISGK